MSYIRKSLMPREVLLYQARLSIWSMAPAIIVGTVLLAAYGLGLIVFLLLYLRYISTELAITNRRVICKTGFISRNTVELSLRKIESIRVDQGILGRLFNFGTIILAGAGTPQAPIAGISDPMTFRRAFLEEQEAPSVVPAHAAPSFRPNGQTEGMRREPSLAPPPSIRRPHDPPSASR